MIYIVDAKILEGSSKKVINLASNRFSAMQKS